MENYEDEKIILKGSAWQFVSSIILRLTSFLYTIILGRMFLQQEVGLFFLSFNIILFFAIFSDLGISNSFLRYVTYYLSKGDEQKVRILTREAPILVSFLTFISSLIVYIFSENIATFFNEPFLANSIKFFSVYLFFNEILSLLKIHFLNFKRFKEVLFYENLQNILKIIITILMAISFSTSSEILVISFILSILVTLIIFTILEYSKIKQIFKLNIISKECLETIKEIMPYGISMSLLSILLFIVYYINIFLIGYLLPSNVSIKFIAIYSIVFALSNTILLFANSARAVVITTISGKIGRENSIKKISDVSERMTKFISLSFFPISSLLLIFPEKFLSFLYGYEYVSGSLTLLILLVSLIILYLSFIQRTVLENSNKLNEIVLIFFLGGLINLIFGFLLIPEYKIEGAAFSSLISYFIITLLVQLISKKVIGYKLELIFLFKYFIAFFISLIPLYIIRMNFFDQINYSNPYLIYLFILIILSYIVSLFLFFSILYILRFFNKGDLHIFKLSTLKLKRILNSFYKV